MIPSLALKASGAALVAALWIGESLGGVPDPVKFGALPLGVVLGYAAVRAGNGRRSGPGG